MSLVDQFHSAHKQRIARLNVRRPEAVSRKIKPPMLTIQIVGGRQHRPPPPPVLKSLPIIEVPPSPIILDLRPRPSIQAILKIVAAFFKISVSRDIKERSRLVSIVFPRQIVMFLAYEMSGLSLPLIGRSMGGLHHTTVLHGKNKIKAKIAIDPATADIVDKLRKELSLSIAERIALAKVELDRLQRIAKNNQPEEGLSP